MNIESMTKEQLEALAVRTGEKPFRGRQIFSWLHEKRVRTYAEMTNLPRAIRRSLEEEYPLTHMEMVEVQTSAHDGTKKFLFELADHNVIESVFMPYHHGNSVCISSQVGCRMGCKFCASTIGGLLRSLDASEMLLQVYEIARLTGERISNVVVMGTGEPLDNYDNLLTFIRLITDADGMNLSGRGITVSTCGLVPEIERLADEHLPITLAISLHAPNDEKRKDLMPIAYRYTIAEVLAACDVYFKKTGRRVSFEYALVAGQNDAASDAEELIRLLLGRNAHVNLIPVNPIKERDYTRSTKKMVDNFKNKLEKNKINVTIRREMGADIDGACGQLRRKYMSIKEQ